MSGVCSCGECVCEDSICLRCQGVVHELPKEEASWPDASSSAGSVSN